MSVWEWDRLRRNEAGDIVTSVPQRFRPGFHGDLVAQLSNTDKFKRAVLYAAHDLPAAVGRKLLALIDPLNIGIVLGTLGAWALAHYFGIGEFVDIVLGGTVIATFGWEGIDALRDLIVFARGVIGAHTDHDLDQAARHLARAVTVLSVDAVTALLLRGARVRARAVEVRTEVRASRVRPSAEPTAAKPPPQLLAERELSRYAEKQGDVTNSAQLSSTPGTAIQAYYPPNGGFARAPAAETLCEGYRFSRYGGFFEDGVFKDFGSFVAPDDVPYEMRALPPGTDMKPLSTYEVVKPIPDVPSGPAAPYFGGLGLGKQHQLPMTIQDYLDQGYIRLIRREVPKQP